MKKKPPSQRPERRRDQDAITAQHGALMAAQERLEAEGIANPMLRHACANAENCYSVGSGVIPPIAHVDIHLMDQPGKYRQFAPPQHLQGEALMHSLEELVIRERGESIWFGYTSGPEIKDVDSVVVMMITVGSLGRHLWIAEGRVLGRNPLRMAPYSIQHQSSDDEDVPGSDERYALLNWAAAQIQATYDAEIDEFRKHQPGQEPYLVVGSLTESALRTMHSWCCGAAATQHKIDAHQHDDGGPWAIMLIGPKRLQAWMTEMGLPHVSKVRDAPRGETCVVCVGFGGLTFTSRDFSGATQP